jgi:histidinol-phosphate/aromatic aminotransferase/cobyric acid decarboxylase-like protein
VAEALLDQGREAKTAFVQRIREERSLLHNLLQSLGARPRQSEANFVFAELDERSLETHTRLVAQGVLVRTIMLAGTPLGLRISLPGEAAGFAHLTAAIGSALRTRGGAQ